MTVSIFYLFHTKVLTISPTLRSRLCVQLVWIKNLNNQNLDGSTLHATIQKFFAATFNVDSQLIP